VKIVVEELSPGPPNDGPCPLPRLFPESYARPVRGTMPEETRLSMIPEGFRIPEPPDGAL
jgi:hypothetical protein